MEAAILIIVVWIMSVCLHEFGHAIVAYAGGDTTVKERGYLTLNPVVYFNSATTLVLPVIILLWGGIPLPGAAVYLNTAKIRSPMWLSLSSFAGPFATFLVMVFLMLLYKVISIDSLAAIIPTNLIDILKPSLAALVFLHAFSLILNLIPMPPLDGWGIIEPWLPENIQIAARRNGNLGFLIIMLLSFNYPPATRWMRNLSFQISDMVGISDYQIRQALSDFHEYSIPLLALIIVTFIVKNIKTPQQKAAEAAAAASASTSAPEASSDSLDSTPDKKTEI